MRTEVLMVAELTVSRLGTVEVCMAHELGTAILEIYLFIGFWAVPSTPWVWSPWGLGLVFAHRRTEEDLSAIKKGEIQEHSNDISKSTNSWLVGCPWVCCKTSFICGTFFLMSLFVMLSRFLLRGKKGKKQPPTEPFKMVKFAKWIFVQENARAVSTEENHDKTFFILTKYFHLPWMTFTSKLCSFFNYN